MPRVSDAKEKILDAAKELFWINNYGSVSVDDICKKADVKKGSFYHFYESKADLCISCLDSHWEFMITVFDPVFSASKPPLQRFSDYAQKSYELQCMLKEQYGSVLGCPVNLTGTELGNEDEKIREKALEILNNVCKYYEAALRDAKAEGLIQIENVELTAKQIFSLVTGVKYHAKISNDPEVIKEELESGIMALIGVKH